MQLEPIWESLDPEPDFEKEWWDEDDWERFMTIQDKKVDQLVKLDTLFLNSGVDRDLDSSLVNTETCDRDCENCGELLFCPETAKRAAEYADEVPDIPEDFEWEERGYENISAYKLSHDFAIRTMELMKDIPEKDYDNDGNLQKLAWNCGIAGAKIASGDGMGYRPDTICGNIANCKRAANAMAASVEALGALIERPKLTKRALKLKELGETALKEIWVRIEELRAEARRLHGE